jgi:tellurite resistance protein TerC
MGITTLTQAKRMVKIMVGFTLLAAGVAMLLLPAPGIVTIAIGLAILSTEFVWARQWLERMKGSPRRPERDVQDVRVDGAGPPAS